MFLKNIRFSSVLVASVLALMGTSLKAAETEINQSGTINFNGEVYSSTCVITINDTNLSLNANPNIELGRHPTSAFIVENAEVKAASTTGDGSIVIKAEDCPTEAKLAVTLTGQAVQNSGEKILQLTSSPATAKNIGIVLYQSNNSQGGDLNKAIKVSGGEKIYSLNEGTVDKSITIYPFYRKINNAEVVNSGSANSTIDYNITYQ